MATSILAQLPGADKNPSIQRLIRLTSATRTPPVDPALISALAAEPESFDARADALANILSTQSADTTLQQYIPHFLRWHKFAEARGVCAIPEESHSHEQAIKTRRVFDMFVLEEYARNSTRGLPRGRTGRDAANRPGTFNQIFSAINHVLTKLYGRPELDSSMRIRASNSYRRRFSRPTKKAKPLRGETLRRFVKFCHAHREPWLNVVAKVIVIMWSTAGRWSCISRMDLKRTLGHEQEGDIPANPDPEGR